MTDKNEAKEQNTLLCIHCLGEAEHVCNGCGKCETCCPDDALNPQCGKDLSESEEEEEEEDEDWDEDELD